jgi:prevent-host-death family protein
MKIMSVSNDIVPIGKFKTSISKWFKSIRDTGHPLIITQNGKPAGVLLSPSEYDELVYKRAFLDSLNRGIADAESGRIYNSEELKTELRKRRKQG